MDHRMIPRISLAVPNFGATPAETLGEFKMMTGRDTTQTHRIWPTEMSAVAVFLSNFDLPSYDSYEI